jgi:hypothetical protein
MTDFEEIMESIESVLVLLAGEIAERVIKRNMRSAQYAVHHHEAHGLKPVYLICYCSASRTGLDSVWRIGRVD